ncbi:MAG TPA: PhoPQ-activated protein PqaA family protein [Candidatus Binatia bacterium]
MPSRKRFIVLALFLLLFAPSLSRAGLEEYVGRPEPAFAWKITNKIDLAGDRVYDLRLVSQTWQGITWEHQLEIYQPRGAAPSATMLLWVTGGSATPAHALLGLELARKIGAPVAFLFQIPNQPLFEEKLREDDLVAETFVRYLKTKDESWPLLFPMVKSVVKAMDALQAFGKAEWKAPAERFVVSGASKRGWTTWLAAAADRRVGAIAPMVIDTLNMREQMPRQLEAFGAYSERLAPYVKRGLLPIPGTPEGERLLAMVDPWSYRDKLGLPKLIVNGSNDFYWVTDALNAYWKQLPGDKWVLYAPNAGHDLLSPRSERFAYMLDGLAAFVRHQSSGKPMPRLSWRHDTANGRLRLTIDTKPAPSGARLWVARAPNQDFRAAVWKAQAVEIANGAVVGEAAPPESGYLAFFGELDYEIEGLQYHLSTQIQITGAPKEKPE